MKCTITHEELATFAAGEVEPGRASEIREHMERCDVCRARINTLASVDRALYALAKEEPPGGVILNAWRAVLQGIRAELGQEIMTLDEVAAFLRVPLDDLEDIVGQLPTFEIAGHIRVRRAKLMEWIEQRERRHMRSVVENEIAEALSGVFWRGENIVGIG